jgi:Ca-activated chloride channel family protein
MNCNDYSKFMTDLLAGEISGKDKAVLDSHLVSCEACKKEFEELQSVWKLTETAFKADFFDDSLKPDQYQKIFNSVKPEILPGSSKKTTPIKFMWLEIAASIVIFVIFAALFLPSLSLPRGKERQFTKINEMKIEKPGTVTGNLHPIVTPKDVFIPQEEKLAEDKSAVNKSRMPAKEISEGEIARGGELLQKGQSQKSDRLKERAAGEDAQNIESAKIAEAPKAAYGNVMFVDGHVGGNAGTARTSSVVSGSVNAPAATSASVSSSGGEKKKESADKSLESDYRYSDNLMAAVAPAASPAPEITAVPAKAAKPEPLPSPIFARKSLKDEDLKRDETSDDYKRLAENKVAESTVATTPLDSGKQLAYGRVDSLKESNVGLKSKAVIGKEEVKKILLIDRNYSLKEMKDGIPFLPTKEKPFSTFSIDVDTASYTMARKLLRNGQKPDSFSVRPEEFINYFDYHYRSPSNSTFAVYLESAPSAFRPENYTLRVGVKARELGPDGSRPSVFTILIDASGSMARENRMELVKKTLPLLFDQMKPDDKVAIFVCTHRAVNIVDYLPVKEKKTIIKLVEGIMPAGVADIENGLVTAYDSASRHYVSGAYNRVILLTDGISNIGTRSAEAILAKVSFARNMGITNTVIALGGDGDDKFLETVANKGDGNYVYIENEEGARELFVNEFAGRFREIARDVKIQVEFNPMIVSQYRQVGYQNRQLSKADFRNDKVDAGEVGAGQSVTALYEMKLNKAFPAKSSDTTIDNPINYSICIVRLRYRRADNMDMEEKEFPLAFHELRFNSDKASCGFRLAAAVAEFAEFLRYPDVPGIANPENIMKQIQGVIGEDYRNDGKVTELYSLVKNVK